MLLHNFGDNSKLKMATVVKKEQVTGNEMDRQGSSFVREYNFLSITSFRSAVGPIQWISGALFPGVKRSGHGPVIRIGKVLQRQAALAKDFCGIRQYFETDTR
jgi:hypothetical protein